METFESEIHVRKSSANENKMSESLSDNLMIRVLGKINGVRDQFCKSVNVDSDVSKLERAFKFYSKIFFSIALHLVVWIS